MARFFAGLFEVLGAILVLVLRIATGILWLFTAVIGLFVISEWRKDK